jgi:hypothetical protein
MIRLTGIRPKIPNYLRHPHAYPGIIWIRWYKLCNVKSSRALISLQLFKPMLPETIRAQIPNRAGAAAMCLNTQTLSQCNRVVNAKTACINPRGDEREMKL